MSVALSNLVTRLQAGVPAYDGVPSDEQYAQAVKDAVGDLAARKPLVKMTTLDIVADQADYTLPADFLRLVSLETPAAQEGVIVTSDGLLPTGLSGLPEERHDIAALTLTITPTPTYDHTRTLRYAARHVLDESDEYPALTEDLARVALLEAQSIALAWQAQAVTQQAWDYTEAEQRVNKANQAKEFQQRGEAAHARYLEALDALAPAIAGGVTFDANDAAYLESI